MSPNDGGADFRHVREYAPGMGVPPPVSANDPRIPPPAPDLQVWTQPGVPALVLPSGKPATTPHDVVTAIMEQDMPRKIGIYSRKGEGYNVALLDEEGDPAVMVMTTAEVIETVLRPILEGMSGKMVNYAGFDYTEEAKRIHDSLARADDAFKAMAKQPDRKIRPMRRAV